MCLSLSSEPFGNVASNALSLLNNIIFIFKCNKSMKNIWVRHFLNFYYSL